MVVPTINHHRIILQQDDGWHALDLDDGHEVWHIPLPYMHTVCGVSSTVFVYANSGMIYVTDRMTGAPIWTTPTTGFCQANDAVVLAATENPLQLHAYESTTGIEQWTVQGGITRAQVVNETLYTVDSSGFQAIDLATGRSRWKNPTITQQAGFGVVEDDHGVYLSTNEGAIYALNRTDGSIRWTLNGYPSLMRDPFMHLTSDHLYIWPRDTLIDIRLDTGVIEHTFKLPVETSFGTMGSITPPLFFNQSLYTLYSSNRGPSTLFAVPIQP